MRSSRRWLLGALLSLLLTAGAIPYLPVPFALRPAYAAITHVGTDAKQVNQTGSTSYTLTLTQQASAGNALVVFISTDNGGIRLPTTVSGGGLTGWTQELSATEGVTGNAGIAIWIGFNASGSGGTSISISGNIQAGDHWGFMAAEFSGVTSTLDQAASTAVGTANGSIATPTITTTNANDLILADFTVNVSGQTYTGSMTSVDSQPTDLETGQATMGAVYSIVSSAGAQSTTWNNSGGAASWTTGIMALQASVAVATTPTGGTDTMPLLGVGSGGGGGGGSIAQPPGGQVGTRDPALQPFCTNCVWNYPIGSAAVYDTTTAFADGTTWTTLPSGNTYINGAGNSQSVVIGAATDPLQNLCVTGGSSSTDTSNTYGTLLFQRHFPNGLTFPANEPEAVFITPDHLTAMEWYWPLTSSSLSACNNLAGYFVGQTYGQVSVNMDLKGPGIIATVGGANRMGIALNTGDEATPFNTIGVTAGNPITSVTGQGDSGLPMISGLIRHNELKNGIHHALYLEVRNAMVNQNAPGGRCFVWPANKCSGNLSGFGTSGILYEGALIAIPVSVNLSAHTFNTTEGKNLALAFQQYGGYVKDTACGGDCVLIQADYNISSEVPNENIGQPFGNDLDFIRKQLAFVTNSYHSDGTAVVTGNKLDGGDGTVSSSLIAPAFDALYGGGNGRSSYFRPFIPWARLAKAFPMFRVH